VKYKVVFRAEARDEAVEAASYIAEQGSPAAARRWFAGPEQAVRSLSVMPRRCKAAPEQNAFPLIELRQLAYKSHRLLFTIRDREVHVLHVVHSARRPDE
jgi:plasmid stabilization system protein ParE